jgi:carbonic anhydrase
MHELIQLFNNNKAWAEKIKQSDPDFFNHLAQQQNPDYLWIGCSDSRVPANQITGLPPGEVFVHRNIANVVAHSDINCLSVLQYAVEVLGVKHVIICGHYGCGGIAASVDDKQYGLIDNWLQNIKNVYRLNKAELESCKNHDAKLDRLCELNVIEQVNNVCHSPIIKNAWEAGQNITIHGWIYAIKDGILHDLIVRKSPID